MLDTNILVSASLFPDSVPSRAFMKAVTSPNKGVVCDFALDELRRVFNRKFPHKISALERFFATVFLSVEIVSTPSQTDAYEDESLIRDPNDRPILRAAIKADVDLLVTGDKDFREADIRHPRIVTAAQFLQME